MKKRLLSLLLVLATLLTIPLTAFAAESDVSSERTIWYEDGSSLVISITEATSRAAGTKTGTAQTTFRNSDGDICWIATLTGTFTYNGTTSTCTSSTSNVTIYDSAWYLISKTATHSGNTAYATITLGKKTLGITTSKPTYNLTLTCDKDGNLS